MLQAHFGRGKKEKNLEKAVIILPVRDVLEYV